MLCAYLSNGTITDNDTCETGARGKGHAERAVQMRKRDGKAGGGKRLKSACSGILCDTHT
jgi:hypothetical protein